jgi:hypothetical protein
MFPPLETSTRGKRERHEELAARALAALEPWLDAVEARTLSTWPAASPSEDAALGGHAGAVDAGAVHTCAGEEAAMVDDTASSAADAAVAREDTRRDAGETARAGAST